MTRDMWVDKSPTDALVGCGISLPKLLRGKGKPADSQATSMRMSCPAAFHSEPIRETSQIGFFF